MKMERYFFPADFCRYGHADIRRPDQPESVNLRYLREPLPAYRQYLQTHADLGTGSSWHDLLCCPTTLLSEKIGTNYFSHLSPIVCHLKLHKFLNSRQ